MPMLPVANSRSHLGGGEMPKEKTAQAEAKIPGLAKIMRVSVSLTKLKSSVRSCKLSVSKKTLKVEPAVAAGSSEAAQSCRLPWGLNTQPYTTIHTTIIPIRLYEFYELETLEDIFRPQGASL